MPHALMTLIYALHVGGGMAALASGTVAVCAWKGGRLHRAAGKIFVVSMLVMAVFADTLAVAIPDQLVNLVIGTLAGTLVLTSWLAIRGRTRGSAAADWIAAFVSVCLCAPFAILSFQLATGMEPLFRSAVPYKGPIIIAVYGFTTVLALAVITDWRVVVAGGLSDRSRIARHLWRMCLGLTMAAGSAFTNGFARLLPGPCHVPPVFFLPQFLPLAVLISWMILVWFTGWRGQGCGTLVVSANP